MKKRELIQAIREIVRREVKKEINKIFIKEESQISLTDSFSDEIASEEEKPKQIKNYVKNPILNRILNETAGGVPQKEGFESYPTMGDGAYDTDRVQEIVAHNYGLDVKADGGKLAREINAVKTIKESGANVETVPKELKNALTRDYTNLMKAIDKKKVN